MEKSCQKHLSFDTTPGSIFNYKNFYIASYIKIVFEKATKTAHKSFLIAKSFNHVFY